MLKIEKEKTIQRKRELLTLYKNYYCENGICKLYKICSQQAVTDGLVNGYNSSFAAMVGDNYDIIVNGKAIRILIVGKEGRFKNECSNSLFSPKRLIGFLDEGKVNLHYRETYKMLCEMLNYNWVNNSIEDTNKFLYKQDSVLTCFALTNMYRCAFKEHSEQVSNIKNYPEQTKNCLEILKEEIKILEPTIIILQKSGFTADDISPDSTEIFETIYYSNALKAYIIESIHPRNYGKWYNDGYPKFSKAVSRLRLLEALPPLDFSTTDLINALT